MLGGYGVFGGRLSQLLLRAGHDVLVAGRAAKSAHAFCREHGGHPLTVDRNDLIQLGALLDRHDVHVLIDATGPFQAYEDTYAIARVALAAEVHYLDLSDDPDFSAGITVLEEPASQIGLACLSGASTVPAISSAIVADVSKNFHEIAVIETALTPGNRAPRGRSVMAAILRQIGAPLAMWRGGAWRQVPGWSGARRIDLPGGLRRRASFIGAPDLALFPEHFKARSVMFRAGLELGVMHGALSMLGWLRQRGLVPRLDRLTGLFLPAARLLEGLGTDQGGMYLRVGGRDETGAALTHIWRLTIGEGNGPMIPALPAALLVDQIAARAAEPGARAVLGDIPLAALETALEGIGARIERQTHANPPLFEEALGADWTQMAQSFRDAHDLWDMHVLKGEASIERGAGFLSELIGAAFRFPPATTHRAKGTIDVTVEMERIGNTEIWRRRFGDHHFRSTLSPAGPGKLRERFGPFTFELALPVRDQRMQMQVTRGWCLGIPLPGWALPVSQTCEYDDGGRFHFDVSLSAPLAGFVIRYRGWLERDG